MISNTFLPHSMVWIHVNHVYLYTTAKNVNENDFVCMKDESIHDCIPNRSLTCDDKIIIAAALVNPEPTGPETKSIMKPNWRTPISISMMPVRNESSTARCQTPPAAWNVSSAANAVGPIGTSLHEPMSMYTKQPMNEPYKPYWNSIKEMRFFLRGFFFLLIK